jgi:transcriptional regulator with PAS, ATPase and Fis domain
VRELENAIERAVILAENQPVIRVQDLPPEVRAGRSTSGAETGSTKPREELGGS